MKNQNEGSALSRRARHTRQHPLSFLLAVTLLFSSLLLPLSSWAADSDGDGCDDLTDSYPADYTRCVAATGIVRTFNGDGPSDVFGYSVSGAGDVNNDGYADVIVGAYLDDNTSGDAGSARVFSGANGAVLYTFNGDGVQDYFGYSVSGAGDVNNDGYADVIVGAYKDDNTGGDSGSARVFSGANGAVLYTFNGDGTADYFGTSVSAAGDVNNDGYADVIVGAEGDDNNGTSSGSARVFSGANGAVLYTFNGDAPQDLFGHSVSAAGDVNNDGYADVIVGAYGASYNGTGSGRARVFSGTNGTVLYTFNGDGTTDNFGVSVSGAGDVNNDGYADVIVGAYQDDNNGSNSGSARVFSGVTGSVLYTFNGDSASDYFGTSVSAAGDVNNDGYADVIVGAFQDDNNGGESGSARVFSGVNGAVLYTFNGDSTSDYFGYSVSAAGDVDNDGHADVIVGAYYDDNSGNNSGSARVFSGKANLTDFDGDSAMDAIDTDDDNDGVLDINDLDPRNPAKTTDTDLDGVDALVDNCPTASNADQLNTDGDAQGNACDNDDDNDGVQDTVDSYPVDASRSAGATGILHHFNGDSASDYFGSSVSAAGDVNNDGYADVIVGAYYDDNNGTDSGSVRVLSGVNGAVLYTFNGDGAGDYFGWSVSDAGDVNKDGYADVIVGASYDDNTGTDSGSARVFSGANGAVLYTFNGDSAQDYFGMSVSAAGDVNKDGYADVIVGAHYDDNAGTNSGSARVFSGANGAVLYTFNGDGVQDYFGYSVSAAGDVNNDGYADVIVGAYQDDNNGGDSGSARVFSGANGAILYTFNGDSVSGRFGYSVSDAGDVNNDGYADVIVGAYLDDNNGGDSGSARVFSGANGAVLYTFNGDGTADYFGYSVSAAGDVNNDGYADVIVGANWDDNNGSGSGSARVFSGATGAVLYTLNGDSASDSFGYSVSAAGDVNKDGYADVIIGAYGDDNAGSNSGSARVFSGRAATADWDADGVTDALDSDDDNDAALDINDSTPVGDRLDVDGDGTGDAFDTDNDNDSVTNAADNCPLQANADQLNIDGDAEGNACDADDDNDSVADGADTFPLNAVEWVDTDSDGTGNNTDTDDDSDGVLDASDNCPVLANADQANVDGDALGNACDADNDNDGIADAVDNCPAVANPFQQDSDGDAVGNYCDPTPFPASGDVNGEFNPGVGANGTLWASAEQADGKFVIGGEFSSYAGVSRNRIARVNADGSLDAGFAVGTGFAGDYVNALAVQPDGKIVAVGLFSQYNGVARNNVARLNTDGSLDTSFITTSVNGPVYAVAVQPDGKTLISGEFTLVGGNGYNRVARLNVDGSVDTTFADPAIPPAWVAAMLVQPDGKIVIGGAFANLPGATGWGIARLNADGSVDNTFAVGTGVNQAVYAMALQADGKILAGGAFTSVNGVAVNRVVRLNSDGTLDNSFVSGAGVGGDFVYTLAARHNKIVIGGGFSSYDGVPRNNVARLNSDGSLDADFNQNGGADGMVYTSTISAGGDLLVGGAFTHYNGIERNRVALIVAYADIDGDGLDNGVDTDDDNDGTTDVMDNCYLVSNAGQANADNDQFGNACDEDDDNDSVLDVLDNCPVNGNALQLDLDGDGQGDVCDADDDADGVADGSDNCPALANTVQADLDADAVGDACDDDKDGDTVANGSDNCPLLGNANQQDTDGDGIGNVCDSTLYGDVDFDGVGDFDDNCPAVANANQQDSDADTLGNACDADQGGVVSVMTPGQKIYASGGEVVVKVMPADAGYTSELWLDQPAPARLIALNSDAGSIVNLGVYPAGQELVFKIHVRNTNRDFYTGPANRNGDNKLHAAANLPVVGPATVGFEDVWGGGDQDFNDNVFRFLGLSNFVDTDGDSVGNFYDDDDDNDGVLDVSDAFPEDSAESVDTDNDSVGNNADADDDNDGVLDAVDTFPLDATESADADGDGAGDNADASDDGDSIDDATDNCPLLANEDQANADGDAQGNACDTDDDNDTVADGADNCPLNANGNQYDSDSDGIGNACDATPFPQAGSQDASFNTGTGFNGTVWATEVQADGKAVIGGEFSSYNGATSNRIARLNTNGSLDTTFTVGTGFTGDYVNMMAIQADGRIVAGGLFTHYNGVVRNNVARLNADGSLDTGFNPSGGVNGPVYAVAVQPDNKVIIGGDFTTVGGISYDRVARLNADGSVDTSFANPAVQPAWVAALAVQADGKIIIGGAFPPLAGATGWGIARLNADGTVDSGFNVGTGLDQAVYSVAVQTDGKILIGGGFTALNGVSANRIARLNADGSADTGFAAAAGTAVDGAHVYSVALAKNHLIIGGSFTSYNGTVANNIARLNQDGSLNTEFISGTGANSAIYASRMQPNGDIVVGGAFTAYNGVTANRVARLYGVIDSDNDGINDAADVDDDNDGVDDDMDNCPDINNTDQANLDRDAHGDACDADDDNDGVLDGNDAFPLDLTETVDTDADGTGNNADTDDDNDGLLDAAETTAGTNALDADSDDDGVSDGDEVNVYASNPLNTDSDNDSMPDGYEVSKGLDPTDGDDDLLDADGDGWTNKQEFDNGADPANAGSKPSVSIGSAPRTIMQPVAVTQNTMTSCCSGGGTYLIADTFNQKGLAPQFTSGVTLFDTYMALNPVHSTGYSDDWYSQTQITGAIDFDFGQSVLINQFVLWHGAASLYNYGVKNFTVYTASEPTFAAAFNAGSFVTTNTTPAQVFNLADSTARYVRLQITSNWGNASNTGIGEIAFETRADLTDTDGDGMPDYWETQYGLDKNAASDAVSDLDGDGLINLQEYINQTTPTVADTDSDGWNDGHEVNVERTNPKVADPVDTDSDGVLDINDRFPANAAEWVDDDNDGTGNNTDTDDDNDTVLDAADNCAVLANTDQLNTDGDTQGNACDTDDDNDGVLDVSDQLPLTPGVAVDADTDGFGESWIATCDAACQVASGTVLDNCPSIANANQLNTDGDAQGNACDTDDDNDGIADASDSFPLDAAEWGDVDSDGIGNNGDTDDDNDGLSDVAESGLGTAANRADTDYDGLLDYDEVMTYAANPLVIDSDGDTMVDGWEVTHGLNPVNANDATLDGDNDGVSNVNEFIAGIDPSAIDSDSDTLADGTDNCPGVSNTDQADDDSNGIGNLCDDKTGLVSAGRQHTCAVTPTGAAKCWGDNSLYQLGIGNNGSQRKYPAQVSGLASGVVAVAAGGSHSCALTTAGAVRCWGYNAYGQLGNGTTVSQSTPVQVIGLTSGVKAIAAGGNHTCAVKQDKSLLCWGSNASGQVGNNSAVNALSPVLINGLASVSRVATGSDHTCAVSAAGVKCWGSNFYGQLGDGSTTNRAAPVQVLGVVSGVLKVSAGMIHSCASLADGTLKCWGSDGYGQLGNGAAQASPIPVAVSGMAGGNLASTAGEYHTCALSSAGAAQCWGENSYGQLGSGMAISASHVPVNVSGIGSGAVAVSAGASHACAMLGNGTVRCWGYNAYGQMGNNATTQSAIPVTIPFVLSQSMTLTQAAPSTVAQGGSFTVAATASSGLPVSITASGACTISGNTVTAATNVVGTCQLSYEQAGNEDVYAASTITSSTSVYDPDLDDDGVLNADDAFPNDATEFVDIDGDGTGNNADTDDDADTVADVADNCPFVANSNQADANGNGRGDACDNPAARLSAGAAHACVVTGAGAVQCWGSNYYGQLGDSTTVNRSFPVAVLGLGSGVQAVAAGGYHSCALTEAGGVKCWGYNTYGQLGDGTTVSRNTPVQVTGLASGVRAIAAGEQFTCAVKWNGQAQCWGQGNLGQLGQAATYNASTPTTSGMSGAIAIAAGNNHACALTNAGAMKCWGYNVYGQLGIGTTSSQLSPVSVVGMATGVASIAAGGSSSCAITTAGAVQCWGYNAYGQVGDGSSTTRTTPVPVSGLTAGIMAGESGGTHNCAVNASGAVQCWGYNYYGQLGDNSSTNRNTPVAVSGLSTGVVAVTGGSEHSCALMATNAVKCWGYNSSGQLGDNSTVNKLTPVDVVAAPPAQSITVTQAAPATAGYGSSFTVAATASSGLAVTITTSGGCTKAGNTVTINSSTVACVVTYSQVGNANYPAAPPVSSTITVSQGTQVITVTAPTATTAEVTTAATINTTASSGLAVSVSASGACTVSGSVVNYSATAGTCTLNFNQAGNSNYLAAPTVTRSITVINPDVDGDGTRDEFDAFPNDPAEWLDSDSDGTGNNADADDDNDTVADASDNCSLVANTNQLDGNGNGKGDVCDRVFDLAAGTGHGCAITAAGGVKCWGYNGAGQLGNGTFVASNTPVPVTGLSNVTALAAGDSHTCALTAAGAVKCWGANNNGALGDGSTTTRPTPVSVTGLAGGVKAITAGYTSTCALLNDGTAKCWGNNSSGQLGDGTTINSLTPATVSGLSDAQTIIAGHSHVCAVKSSGQVMCWGFNSSGQLGNGVYANSTVPVAVPGLAGVVSMGAGWYHSCAITNAGALKCWGNNSSGQLGDGTTTNSPAPVSVSGMGTAVSGVTGGFTHSCAVMTNGTARCWGGNAYGQLGDNSTTNRNTPVPVAGLAAGADIKMVDAGYYQSCAISNAGQIQCWGYNNYGQLGDGTTTNRLAPVIVYGTTSQAITVNAAAPAMAVSGAQFTVAATASSGLPVEVTVAGTGCSVSGNTVTMGTADCTVSYSQAGNATYLPAVMQYNTVQMDNDTDGDGIGNATDTDDDNDGVPDTLDSEPLNPAIAVMPLNGVYKGSVIRDGAGVQ